MLLARWDGYGWRYGREKRRDVAAAMESVTLRKGDRGEDQHKEYERIDAVLPIYRIGTLNHT